MASGKHRFVFEQGTTISRTVTWTGPDGTPIDITGYSAAMQIRENYESPTTILSLASPADITVGGVDGVFVINVTAAVMTGLADGKYVYDFEVTSAGGTVTRLLQGALIITPEVTK